MPEIVHIVYGHFLEKATQDLEPVGFAGWDERILISEVVIRSGQFLRVSVCSDSRLITRNEAAIIYKVSDDQLGIYSVVPAELVTAIRNFFRVN